MSLVRVVNAHNWEHWVNPAFIRDIIQTSTFADSCRITWSNGEHLDLRSGYAALTEKKGSDAQPATS